MLSLLVDFSIHFNTKFRNMYLRCILVQLGELLYYFPFRFQGVAGTESSYKYDVDFCTRFLCGEAEHTESNASVLLPFYHIEVVDHFLVT